MAVPKKPKKNIDNNATVKVKKKTDKPAKQDKQEVRAYLTSLGVSLGQAKQIAKEDEDNATSQEVVDAVIAWQKTLTKS
jgi:hypothetical protein